MSNSSSFLSRPASIGLGVFLLIAAIYLVTRHPPAPAGGTESDSVLVLYSGCSEDLIAELLDQFSSETGTRIEGWDGREKGLPIVYYSDDLGRTWKKDRTRITPTSERKLVLQENGVVELEDGRLRRTARSTSASPKTRASPGPRRGRVF